MSGKVAFWGLLLLFLAGSKPLFSQFYYVRLADKPTCSDVSEDFSEKALERRERHGIAFPMWEDLPLNADYVGAIGAVVDSVRHELRWLNAVSVVASPVQVAELEKQEWVVAVEPMEELRSAVAQADVPSEADSTQLAQLYRLQRRLMNMDLLIGHGLDGKGVRIAVFDAGFKGADEHPGLAHLYEKGLVLKTRDFYAGKKSVYRHREHGTSVLSCIAGYYQGKPLGAAPAAEFLLARTEHGLFEKYKEEDAWLAAMEWADREGADIINSSLGYGKKRYTYADMDGRTTKVTNAARMACRKGILVVNSAGNTGNEDFKYLTAPGDADSVLTVGASHPMIRYPMRFTAYGPSASGHPKPDVSAPGYVVAADKRGGYDVSPGTSFSCPLIAGLAACIMQQQPAMKNMDVHQQIRSLGHLTPYFDYRLGSGVPNVEWLFEDRKVAVPTFEVSHRNDSTFILLDPEFTGKGRKRDPNGKPFHYQFIQENGQLSFSTTIRMHSENQGLAIPDKDRKPGRLRVWFEGYFWEEPEGK